MGKILYIDETEDNNYFIVAGLLADSSSAIDRAYKHFKHSVKNYSIRLKEKELVFNEFKSTILDKRYQKIKIKMLEAIKDLEGTVIYSVYEKSGEFRQDKKEEEYLMMISNIVKSVDDDVVIIFDAFHKKDFENKISDTLNSLPNVIYSNPAESYNEAGLQFVDNICSSIRRYLNNSHDVYFNLIKSFSKKV